MKNMRVAKKLHMTTVFIIVMMAIGSAAGAIYIDIVDRQAETLSQTLMLSEQVKDIKVTAQLLSVPTHDYIRDGSPEAKQNFKEAFDRLKATIDN